MHRLEPWPIRISPRPILRHPADNLDLHERAERGTAYSPPAFAPFRRRTAAPSRPEAEWCEIGA